MILTRQEYKQAKGISGSGLDAQIDALLPMIDDAIKRYCKWNIEKGTFTEKREGFIDHRGFYMFAVLNYPVESVSSIEVSFYGATSPMTVDVSQLDIFSKAGYMVYASTLLPGTEVIRDEYKNNFYYTIEYVGGLDVVPEGIKMAAVMALSDAMTYFYGDQVASGNSTINGSVKQMKVGDYSVTMESTTDKLKVSGNTGEEGIILSTTVKQLLKPFIHTGQNMSL